MKTFNTYYTDQKSLIAFIQANNITNSRSLLIQVFTSTTDKLVIQEMTSFIDELLPSAYLIGSTTDGVIKDGDVTTDHTVISFTLFEKTSLDIFISDEWGASFEAGRELARSLIQDDTKAIISFIEGITSNGEEFLNGISSINSSVIVAGGLASDNAKFEITYVFTKDTILSNGVAGVSLNSNELNIYTDYSFHWLPLGRELKITKAVGNRVYTIDHQTAYDTYAYYLGEDIAQGLPAIGTEFTLMVRRDGINIARTLIAKKEDGSFIFSGNLKNGDTVMFGYGDSNAILSYKEKYLHRFTHKSIESIFIYSCMARRRFMPELIHHETKPFNTIAPTSGFFTYGEFYTASKNELLNQTMTIFALSESTITEKPESIQESHEVANINNYTMKALSHLITASSEKSQQQNQMQTDVYEALYDIGKGINETLKVDELFDITTKFVTNTLKFEKCLIFKHDDKNGWFKIDKAIGYDDPQEKMILEIIHLLLSGEIIEYLRINDDPIIHTTLHPNKKVEKLAKSLFLDEAYFQLFGGDIEIPYGLVVVGNGFKNLDLYSRILTDDMIMLALGNFTIQLSNSINNSVFYKALNNEKKGLEVKIESRTKELIEQKETFEAIYNGSKDAIGILDMQSNFLDVNPAYIELTGMSKEELLATSCLALTAKKDLEISRNAMAEVLKVGYIKNFEKDCDITGIKYFSINMSMSLLRNPDRILISVRDVTQVKESKQVLETAKTKAEENAKLKSEFLANMSHEIRTPMNGILGMSHLVLETNLNDKQKDYIQKIENSAKSLREIINDILDFSKIEAGKLTIEKIDFDIYQMIENIVSLVDFKIYEKNLDLIVNYDKRLSIFYHGDSLRISQILINLLGNAIKFTDAGKIGIYITKTKENKLRFTVSDTGIGLTEKQKDKLFQSFSQADGSTTRKYGGTGLGLMISKQLVELMGGTIWIESEVDVGSKFIFEIALKEIILSHIDEEPHQSEWTLKDQITTLAGSKVLLTEDNDINQEIILGFLEESGIDITIANNGQEAVDQFKANKFELILMDLQMPIMDGFEATKQIRQIDKEIPIIALTANAMIEDAKKTKLAGMNEHLNKPLDVEFLYKVLLKYISKKTFTKELDETPKSRETEIIDTSVGLEYFAGNKKLYLKILNTFKDNYCDLNFETLTNQEFIRTIHTLKGTSASIGATKLSITAQEYEDSKISLAALTIQLKSVLKELNQIIAEGIIQL